ncbi:MAG: hypothetical protein JWM20_837 [Patescibacteria group bacterium]|nr:hypothetical protein [Patescibacteria group bacterium]
MKFNPFKIILSVASLILAGSVFYYFIIYLPSEKQMEHFRTEQGNSLRNSALNHCFQDVQSEYQDDMTKNCFQEGFDDCSLNPHVAGNMIVVLNNKLQADKQICIKEYGTWNP